MPVFVDVLEDTFNMAPESLSAAIAMIRREGRLRPRVVMPVDLFGQAADYRLVEPIVAREKLLMLCDTAQAFGAIFDGRRTGAIGDASATSFFPAKPLGCYGDGGCSFTDDDSLADLLRSIRMHGQGADKYDNVRIGVNSRLDTIQAAILIEKLRIFPDELDLRDEIARRYSKAFAGSNRIRVPHVVEGARSSWAQYTIQVPERDRLKADLDAKGIPAQIYYLNPLSMQRGYREFPSVPLPVSTALGRTVISLPMHPYLDASTQDMIVDAVMESVGRSG
jgi:dTDP-4-amino-4,6-dideoxygalactose transaminase